MDKKMKFAIYLAIVVLTFFLIVSLITERWGFFIWSLLPVFMSTMITFTQKAEK
ncbi:hypothetical protein M3210_18505 [Oceanobacillus luteolus]|mgnify:CR=1 FL=1|uniref:Uncharacterized protein n=1 Tax=Oceanobacillus luteolus TaxID=1274358 RepID=A0ABW4HQ64_9BACI|nr:hypothetical protein [Oceanobacillus luteolus]MCM3742230.1 hypothetical protein [Oceanobacillus luteolus]